MAKQRDLKAENPAQAEPEPSLKPAPRDKEVELSYGQEMVWLLEQINPEAMFYNIVERFGIKGELDIALLRRCIDEVVKRHEVLRTVYPVVAGQAVQKIEAPMPCDLRVLDLRQVSAQERDAEAQRLIVADVKTRFDLTKGPLFRPLLLRVQDEDYILAVVIHHIAIDGWSLRLFINEIVAFYDAFSEGRTPNLAPIQIQYADFAYWQRRWLTGSRLNNHRDYWRGRLGQKPPVLKLRTDYAPGQVRTFDSAAYHTFVPSDVVEGLREIGRCEGATFFTVLLAGFATLLMRYTGQEDFVIGSVISSRTRPEVESLLGFFVNSLALRTDMTGNPTFSSLVARTREIVFAAHEHGAFPFHRLVEVMRPNRDVNSNPFAQIFLNMLNLWDREEVSLPNLSIRPLGGLDLHMPVDLFTLFASVSAQQLSLTFVYSHNRANGAGSLPTAGSGGFVSAISDLGFTDVN
jgi:aspartate racemase